MKKPFIFDEFFALGLEESVSPFLTEDSRKWGKNLPLKLSLLATFFLVLSFILFFLNGPYWLLCVSIVYFIVGIPSFIQALEDLKNLEINIDVLMTLAAFSCVSIGSPLEGALLLVLFNLSHALEEILTLKTSSAIHSLHKIAPKLAHIVSEDGQIQEKSINDIETGELILVKNGEIIPLDGVIEKGSTTLNFVHLTGESLPVFKTVQEEVPSGATNLQEAILIKVTRKSQDSTLSKIISLITTAQEAKPKTQNFLDRFGGPYATAVMILTAFFCVLLPYVWNIPFLGFDGSIYRCLSFLIAASPCALILALPTAYMSALSASARKGILLKGGIVLDALEKCSIFAFDKTGTITLGELRFENLITISETKTISKQTALAIALGLEYHVKHPISYCIQKTCQEQNISQIDIDQVQNIPGFGVKGNWGQIKVAIGNWPLLLDLLDSTELKSYEEKIKKIQEPGKILTLLLVGNELLALQFSDILRPRISNLISELKQKKIRSIMLTGDHKENAEYIGKKAGIDSIFSGLKPEDKLHQVAYFSEKHHLAMIGDGTNDAPSLARATVGISMGKVGSQAAIDSSDVVLLNDNIELIGWLYCKAKKTKKIVYQNLFIALSVIGFATIPALAGFIPLWAAVILHEGGTVIVALNSLRLLKN